jgi:hypothetical protein
LQPHGLRVRSTFLAGPIQPQPTAGPVAPWGLSPKKRRFAVRGTAGLDMFNNIGPWLSGLSHGVFAVFGQPWPACDIEGERLEWEGSAGSLVAGMVAVRIRSSEKPDHRQRTAASRFSISIAPVLNIRPFQGERCSLTMYWYPSASDKPDTWQGAKPRAEPAG